MYLNKGHLEQRREFKKWFKRMLPWEKTWSSLSIPWAITIPLQNKDNNILMNVI